ncbi:outer membrane beta-barrel family protein [Siphonobacter sp. SORGH_AS_1065]|uniref:outer membrane beta-barrel family protein n=1 Tax=Siphonobacter sp. SORGH_AS_1065 TaxID=3041795 RepID=UPI00278A2303|nr:outer membrane beta-barrel family protein [Siphonobacter sp. SORGH_AS_1065]MDQ1088169.1 iron complex outermembrane receptor protein [Siphonobacter sp. SORGH_AS_1065]
MKTFIYTLILFICGLSLGHAQSTFKGSVSGKIIDKTGKAVEFATVMVLKSKDSTLVKGGVADADGNFEIEGIAEGRYLVATTQVGFAKKLTPPFILNAESPKVKLAALIMDPVSQELKEVKVAAAKPFIEQQIDKTVVNVENSIVAAGNNALEVLERSPGVTVDRDGNISLKGKAQVRVMIDGKPTYLSSEDLANLLRNTQANQLEKIEIMTNPSSKYDAAGNAGIINIRTKKNQNMGMNGSATLGVGYGLNPKGNASLNLNYRKDKWNVYGNYSGGARKNWRDQRITRRFREGEEVTALFEQSAENITRNHNNNVKLGADYFASKKTTIGAIVNTNTGSWGSTGDNITKIYQGTSTLEKITTTGQDFKNTWKSLTTNLNLKHTIDSTGKELTADVDYARYDNRSDQKYKITTVNPAGVNLAIPRFDMGNTKGIVDIYSAKIDYTHPLSKNSKLEAGLKTALVTTNNNMKFTIEQGDVARLDSGRTNQFIYRETINAAYLNYSTQIKKTSIQLGLRGEQTVMRGNQVTSDTSFRRNYLNLFPSVFIRQELNKKNSLGMSYSYRIDRPDYEDLNPFLYFLDLYTYQQGNPYLRPQFSHVAEVTHSLMGFINTTLNYGRSNGIITEVLRQNDAARTTYINKENFGFRENYGVAVSANIPITKKWMSINYINVNRNRFVGLLNGGEFDGRIVTTTFNTQNQFTLPNNWSAEISGFYMSGFLEGTIKGKPMWQVSLGLQKQFWEKKASLKLNVRDIFWTQQFRGSFVFGNVDMQISNKWENRVANLTFSYRFGNSKVQASRRRSTGLESEAGRVNQGSN